MTSLPVHVGCSLGEDTHVSRRAVADGRQWGSWLRHRSNRRRAKGLRVYNVEADEADLTSYLIERRYLRTDLQDNARAVGAAVSQLLTDIMEFVEISTIPRRDVC